MNIYVPFHNVTPIIFGIFTTANISISRDWCLISQNKISQWNARCLQMELLFIVLIDFLSRW